MRLCNFTQKKFNVHLHHEHQPQKFLKRIFRACRRCIHALRNYYENKDAWVYETRKTDDDQDAMRGFEPHAALKIYEQMLWESGVPVVMGDRLDPGQQGIEKRRNRVGSISTERGIVYRGCVFIDATYEGDLLAMAGVKFHVGREANARYGETLAGIQKVRTRNHIFPGIADPCITPGNPGSSILPGVHTEDPGVDGEGDHRVQACCFRICLTDVPENRIDFEKPDGYDEFEYELPDSKGMKGKISGNILIIVSVNCVN
jgi:hypothetical protein